MKEDDLRSKIPITEAMPPSDEDRGNRPSNAGVQGGEQTRTLRAGPDFLDIVMPVSLI